MSRIKYNVIFSNRKTIAFVIDREGNFTVRAPRGTTKAEIARLVEEKQGWIEEKQRLTKNLRSKYEPIILKDDGTLPYLGKMYRIKRENVKEPLLREDMLVIPLFFEAEHMKKWLREQAAAVIFPRVHLAANALSLRFGALRTSDAKGRWGSCGAKNSLNFSWRLIMAPPDLVDYVIIHELCHLKHKNHSAAFWAEVQKHMPDYRERELLLKENRELLSLLP